MSSAEIELINFFIFNPELGQRDEEEKQKILFYHPPETDIATQLKNVGLCEAIIKFTESFNPDRPCNCLHTEKTKQFLHEAEKGFWLVMTVSVPPVLKNKENDKKDKKDKNYDSDNDEDASKKVQENVYEAVLKKSYRMYKIFCNSFKSVLESDYSEEKLGILRDKLKGFYSSYLSTLELSNCGILDVFQGITFLPLRKEPFLQVQSFINLLETKFKAVRYSAFLYDIHLVWSEINSEDMQTIYQYLIYTLLPSHLDLEFQGDSLSLGNSSSVNHYGSFVTGPSNLKDSIVSIGKVPKIYLSSSDEKVEVFHLVVYKALSATLCLFIDENESLSLELFKSLDSYLGPHLTTLMYELSEHCSRLNSATKSNEGGPKALYFNKSNLAQRSTMHIHKKRSVNVTVPSDSLEMISELSGEKSELDDCGEVMMLTMNDCWLVGRYSNSRELYLVFPQKKGSLIDISDEVKKFCDTTFKGIFME